MRNFLLASLFSAIVSLPIFFEGKLILSSDGPIVSILYGLCLLVYFVKSSNFIKSQNRKKVFFLSLLVFLGSAVSYPVARVVGGLLFDGIGPYDFNNVNVALILYTISFTGGFIVLMSLTPFIRKVKSVYEEKLHSFFGIFFIACIVSPPFFFIGSEGEGSSLSLMFLWQLGTLYAILNLFDAYKTILEKEEQVSQ